MGVREFGGPEALHALTLPIPEPGPGEVRIKVLTAAVNPADTHLVAGAVPPTVDSRPVWVPGMDVAGHVDKVGEPAGPGIGFRRGDAVVALVIPFLAPVGGYAEYVVVPSTSVAAAPERVPLIHAAALPMNGLTARRCLDLLDLPAGSVIAVTGAAGALGGYVVQLARAQDLHVIADASQRDRALVESLGADIVVDRGEGFVEQVRAACADGVDGLIDGAVLGKAVTGAVRDGGTVVSVRGWRGPAPRGIHVVPAWVAVYRHDQNKLRDLCQQADQGALTVRIADVLRPKDAAQAHRRLGAGGVRGRLLLAFGAQTPISS